MTSPKPFVPKIGECSTPNISEHREDNPTSLSLLSLLGDVREALQSVIASGELNLDEIDPDQVIMPESWVPSRPQSKLDKQTP